MGYNEGLITENRFVVFRQMALVAARIEWIMQIG